MTIQPYRQEGDAGQKPVPPRLSLSRFRLPFALSPAAVFPLPVLLGLLGLLLALAASGMQRGAQPPLWPDPRLTPGDVLDVTRADVCTPGYAHKVRNVPAEVKRQAYAEYGIASHQPGDFEIDHLISLELGGSNSLKNLWPQSYKTQPWNAHVKDKLENELHAEVCSGKISLATAQRDISHDWIAAYKRYFRTGAPLGRGRGGGATRRHDRAATARPASAQPLGIHALLDHLAHRGKVWVNTRSGVYWRPGTRYYGKTKEGKYMTENEAIREGYHMAQEPNKDR
jgi:hypothetical protein